jgi:osmoprotectant transport system ATP-binding protein
MLLDEPFGALDPTTRERLQQEFRELQRALGVTAIFVTHDMTEALTLADRIAVMRDGRIARLGTPQALLRDPGRDEIGAFLSTPLRQAARVRAILEEGRG